MKPTPRYVITLYLVLSLLSTLATSLIWGINTLFLLDAGLTNFQAFLTNAFFTVGQVLFEVPTGVLADVRGRKTSYILGTVTLAISTLVYLYAWYTHASLWWWGGSSVLLGLGFTFFSGATEAWLVDSLEHAGYKGSLDAVFAKGQMIGGAAMLSGSLLGGIIAQNTNLGVPYLLRAAILFITFLMALIFMKDWGFERKQSVSLLGDMRQLFVDSARFAWQHPPVRWIMATSLFTFGVSFYLFYAMQPHLLALYGDGKAYSIASLAAAIVAGAQIIGSTLVPLVQRTFPRRTTALMATSAMGIGLIGALGFVSHFWLALGLFALWGLLGAAVMPARQTYLNGLIPSAKRATMLSFDSLMGSSSGVVIQPALGKVADVYGYPASFFISAGISTLAIPFFKLARSERAKSDNW